MDNDRLEELSAQVLSRANFTANKEVAAVRVTLARVETKLDAALALRQEFDAYEQKVDASLTDVQVRLAKLEGFRGVAVWIASILAMVISGGSLAFIGYLLTTLANMGVSP